MPRRRRRALLNYQVLELAGVRYAVLPEEVLLELCRGLALPAAPAHAAGAAGDLADLADDQRLAARLVTRRQAVGLGQGELARRAGIRPETLNRIERGHTTPDFTTIRKLVLAIQAAARESAAAELDAAGRER